MALVEALKVARYNEKIYQMKKEIEEGTFKKEKPIYRQQMRKVEIHVTDVCNMRCPQCISSCPQAPSKYHMPLEKINEFIEEFISNKRDFSAIKIYGGEPVLHPQYLEIPDIVKGYKDIYPKCKIEWGTHGLGKDIQEKLKKLPKWISIENSGALGYDKKLYSFRSFNIAPIDTEEYKDYTDEQFSIGCRAIYDCGIGVCRTGYYTCNQAASIDRIFGIGFGIKELKDISEKEFRLQRKKCCKYCGLFKYPWDFTTKKTMSKTWIEAYRKYNREVDK